MHYNVLFIRANFRAAHRLLLCSALPLLRVHAFDRRGGRCSSTELQPPRRLPSQSIPEEIPLMPDYVGEFDALHLGLG
jgi:hypothetical protein